jgi:hypothetical protein
MKVQVSHCGAHPAAARRRHHPSASVGVSITTAWSSIAVQYSVAGSPTVPNGPQIPVSPFRPSAQWPKFQAAWHAEHRPEGNERQAEDGAERESQQAASIGDDAEVTKRDDNVSPRASFARSPRKDAKTVIRGGAGVFYDRSGSAPIAGVLLHDGNVLRSYTIENPSYPNALGGVDLSGLPVDVTRLASDAQIPWSIQYGASAEHTLGKKATVVVGYRGSRGHHLFRSFDANGALPPDYITVPNPALGHVQEIRTDGHQRTDALELTVNGSLNKWLRGQAQYTLSSNRNDTGGLSSYASNPFAPLRDEWGPADFDLSHRLNLLDHCWSLRRRDTARNPARRGGYISIRFSSLGVSMPLIHPCKLPRYRFRRSCPRCPVSR